MRFSATRLSTWQDCGLMAKFKYEDKLPDPPNAKTTFGSIIHHCLEAYNLRGNLDYVLDLFDDLWANPEKFGPPIEIWPKFTDYAGLRTRGLQILREYHDKQKFDQRDVLFAEHRFLVPFGQHELTGAIDLGELRKNGKGVPLLKVVDYKTKSRKPTIAELSLNVQLTIYLYAVDQPEFWLGNGDDFPGLANGEWLFETLKDVARRAIWYHLWTNQELDAGPRTDKDFQRLYRLCEEISRAQDAGIYIPTISGESCIYCAYADGPCPVAIPSAEELRQQEDAWI